MGLLDKLRSIFSPRKAKEARKVEFRNALSSAVAQSQVDLELRRFTAIVERLEPLVRRVESERVDADLQPLAVAVRSLLASALYELNAVEDAIKLLERAVTLGRQLPDKHPLVTALHELTLCYRRIKLRPLAISACEEAAHHASEDGVDLMPLYTLGILRFEDGRFEEARHLFEHARDSYENRHELVQLGRVYNELSLVTEKLGDPRLAVEYAEKSIALKQQTGDRSGYETTRRNLVNIVARHPDVFPPAGE